MYLLALLVWLPVTPLVAYHYNNIPPLAILLGPPLELLTSIALLFGFLLLLGAACHLPVTGLLALPVEWSLRGCQWLVHGADRWVGSYTAPEIPLWWIAGWYAGLITWLTMHSLDRCKPWALLAGGSWLCLGLLLPFLRVPTDELRCTFLAVGHGGCTVLETPDGRTILYDTGSMKGPQVVRYQIAPFLAHRGIRRIDEVIFSHADMDHFNGIQELLARFAIGRVICTPSFSEKETPGVEFALNVLRENRIPIEIVKAGDEIHAGDKVMMEVLHPPEIGPEGTENVRSLTLRVKHQGHQVLLTGDLEAEGLRRVLQTPTPRIDVLMAPHHGSRNLDTERLVRWAGTPWVVISSQGRPRGKGDVPEGYQKVKHFLRTWDSGAVTVRSHSTGLIVETFLTQERYTRAATLPRKKTR
jgi:competence protein ComEC